jgi:hypothetical protein
LIKIDDLIQRSQIYFYQDVPYLARFPKHSNQIVEAFELQGGRVQPEVVDIAGCIDDKLRLASIFGSQFNLNYIKPVIEKSAQINSKNSKFYEIRYKITGFPENLNELELYSGCRYVKNISKSLRNWYPKNHNAKKITILCPTGVGKFSECMSYVLNIFPDSFIEIFISHDTMDETIAFESNRVLVKPVMADKISWIKQILGIIFKGPSSLVIVTHSKLDHLSSFLKIAYFFYNPLFITSLDHFVVALRHNQRSE